MPCFSRLVVGLAALDGFTEAAGVTARHGHTTGQVASTGPLFNLVKELRSEGASGHAFQQSMAEWCHSSLEQNKDLTGVLQRRLEEAATGSRQLEDESRRIKSEESLANSTSTEKQHQLQEATATAKLASDEFRTQQRQLDKIQAATEKALKLVGQSPASGATEESMAAVEDLSESLVQVPTLKMAVSSSGSSAAELSNMLDQLQSKLKQDRGVANADHQRMLARLKTFTNDLNSSIQKSHSQVVQLKMEAAQRAREQSRLDGQRADFAALLQAVERSAVATKRACSEEDARKGEMAAMVKAESAAVDTLLRQLTLAEPASHDLQGSLAFVQTAQRAKVLRKGLRSPDDEDMTPDEVQSASAKAHKKDMDDHAELLRKLEGMEAAAKVNLDVVDDSAQVNGKSDALQDISKFVKSDEGKKDTSKTQKGLLGRHRAAKAKAAASASGKHAGHHRSQCESLLKKYAGQSATLAQTSSDTMSGELQVTKRAISGYEDQVAFDQQQHDSLQKKLAQFAGLATSLETSTKTSTDALRTHAEELMTLSVDLSQKVTSEEQDASKATRALAQKLLSHVGTLANRRVRFNENRAAVEAADQAVMNLFAENVDYNHRRIVQLTPEMQVLSSLVEAKTRDNTFANEYQELVDALCAKEAHL